MDDADSMREGEISVGDSTNLSSESLTLDQIKEMAEDNDEYFLRFYRAS